MAIIKPHMDGRLFEFLYRLDIIVALSVIASAISLYMYFHKERNSIGLVMSVTALLLVSIYVYSVGNYLAVVLLVLTAFSMVISSIRD